MTHQQIGKKVISYLFLFLFVGSVNNIEILEKNFFKLNKIKISGLNETESRNLLDEINKLNIESILFINKKKISKIINSDTSIEKYQVFKKYPSTLDIKIKKTIFLAKINYGGKIHLLGSNAKLSENNALYQNLPYIFGKLDIKEFFKLKRIIDQSKISFNEIKNFYFYPSKRWDIELKNGVILKLSKANVKNSLNNSFKFLKNTSFKNVRIIDARVKRQIIINE